MKTFKKFGDAQLRVGQLERSVRTMKEIIAAKDLRIDELGDELRMTREQLEHYDQLRAGIEGIVRDMVRSRV